MTVPDRSGEPRGELTGRALGEFIVGEILGRGGFGDVYLAWQPSLQREAVVKVMRPTSSRGDAFEREARRACQLDHPYAAHVYAFGTEPDGVRWIAMERIRGRTLTDHLERGHPPSVDELVTILEALCEVVDSAHQAGLVHRDIKPDNVMVVERAGRLLPKLLDFGVATGAAADDDLERTGDPAASPGAVTDSPVRPSDATISAGGDAAIGTPAYMAPEQWQAGSHDHRVDIYALGVLAYRCFAGRVPFAAPTLAELCRAHATAPVPPIGGRTFRRFDPVIERSLAKRPADRYPSARELGRALRAAATPLARARLRRVGFAATVLALIGTAVAVIALRARHASTTWAPRLRLLPAYEENTDRPLFSPDGRWIAFGTDRDRPGRFRVHVARPDGLDDHPVTPPTMSAGLLAWSPDGALLVTDLVNESTHTVPVEGGAPALIAPAARVGPCGDRMVTLELASPDCATCQRFAIREGAGAPRELIRFAPRVRVTAFRCDATGTRLAYAAAASRGAAYQPTDLWVIDTAGGAPRQLTDDRAFNDTPAFAPGGRSIVFSSARGGRMNLWEISVGGGVPRQLTTGEGNDYGPDFSPDGRELIYNVDVTSAPLVARTLATDWLVPRRINAARVRLQHLVASPGGGEVFATDYAAREPELVAIDLATGGLRRIGPGKLGAPTPDGRELVYVANDDTSTLVAISLDRAASTPRTIGVAPGVVERMRVGPDGWLYLTVARAGALEAWRVSLAAGAAEQIGPGWTFALPSGSGTTAWFRYDPSTRRSIAVVGRDPAPDPAAPRLSCAGQSAGELDARGAALFYFDGEAVRRYDVATGTSTVLFETGELGDAGLTVAPDGATVYTAATVGRIQRVVIENVASRSAPP